MTRSSCARLVVHPRFPQHLPRKVHRLRMRGRSRFPMHEPVEDERLLEVPETLVGDLCAQQVESRQRRGVLELLDSCVRDGFAEGEVEVLEV